MPAYKKPRNRAGRIGEIAESIFGEIPMPGATAITRPIAGAAARVLAQRPKALQVLDDVMEGAGQVMPSARDAMQMIHRLRGGASKVPTSRRLSRTAAPEPVSTPQGYDPMQSQSIRDLMHPGAQAMQERMFRESNPVFRRMQASGMFNRFSQ